MYSEDTISMTDDVSEATKDLKAWVVRVDEGQAQSLMDSLLKPGPASKPEVLVTKADMVFGNDHLRSALYHAARAMREGTSSSESLAMETLLYASGERQLSAAIKKMSVDGRTREVVIAQLTPGSLPVEETWKALEDRVADATVERLVRFGIDRNEIATLGMERAVELVLEKVAAVDILKK